MGASGLLPLFYSFHPRRSSFPLLSSLPLRSRPGPFFPGMDKTSIPVHSVPRVLDSDLGLPTPVRAEVLDRLLEGYDATIRDTLVKGFLVGFDLGFRGTPSSNLNVKNLASISHIFLQVNYLKTLTFGRWNHFKIYYTVHVSEVILVH